MPTKKRKTKDHDEWLKEVRGQFRALLTAIKENSLVLAEEKKSDGKVYPSKIYPRAIIADSAMAVLIKQPEGEYEVLNQDGTVDTMQRDPEPEPSG